MTGPLGELVHFLMPTEEGEHGEIIEESKEKSATVLTYCGARTRHLHDRCKAHLRRIGATPKTYQGNIQFHLNGNDIDDAVKTHGLWQRQIEQDYQDLADWSEEFEDGQISFVAMGDETCWRKDKQGAWNGLAARAKHILAGSGHPVIDPSKMYRASR